MVTYRNKGYAWSQFAMPTSLESMYYCFSKKVGDDEYHSISNLTSCKDYAGDVVFYNLLGASSLHMSTHKGSFNAEEKLVVTYFFYNEDKQKHFMKKMKVFNRFERKIGYSETIVKKVNNMVAEGLDKKHFASVLIADPKWKDATLKIDIFLFLTRLMLLDVGDKRTIQSYFEAVASRYSTQRDTVYSKIILESGISFEFLMNNISEILGNNPLTGLDDKLFIDKYKNGKGVGEAKINIGKIGVKVTTDVSHNHGYHGIRHLASSINTIKNAIRHGYVVPPVFSIGTLWAYNYCRLTGHVIKGTYD
jgi:hypothetical protein